ncbi:hypothetical protein SERLA73DRAFT_176643 [Serpula lacrymans var. lacrymans S7.3]|uniref:Uncharacterized protein n=2 Tax=Serpula lacrymans var. lacrymans TaxID=341189 RepID=F8PNE1_SERL3|nr:uncharacterized protein SERLADRAFT_459768 [Serpula lacrymans var. lacrymans S7.9]EGO03123.1 hypothetical protein SERLA73DRAFT_176643 [Serpula lacrymans var. lacrymans S7.3]EGO28891.1 hypothetical protein SERLADRAFT_459768 [Serpula lacrymans var. lacrymans S7.9]
MIQPPRKHISYHPSCSIRLITTPLIDTDSGRAALWWKPCIVYMLDCIWIHSRVVVRRGSDICLNDNHPRCHEERSPKTKS